MAYTGTTTFYPTQAQIVTRAAAKIGVLDTGEGLDAATNADFVTQLQLIVKETMAEGVSLWTRLTNTLFLQKGQQAYNLGPSGDNWTTNFAASTLSAAAAKSTLVIHVASATGFGIGYYIGIVQTDGSTFWTTVSNIVGTTITLAAGLSVGSNGGQNVYCYQTKADRPQKILYVNRRYTANLNQIIDVPVDIIASMDYMALPQKWNPGQTLQVQYEPILVNGTLKVWPPYDGTSQYDQLQMVVETIIEDFTNPTDNPYYPTEWSNFLVWRLAAEMAFEFGVDFAERDRLWQISEQKKGTLLAYNTSEAPLQFGLRIQGKRR